jgi:hypothetical protein
VVAPRSELRLPATPQPSGFTRVIQTLGTMLFKVRHTGTPHFAVDTPMLAAVVKGTTFTIVVDKDRSAVQVIEGAVQVVATDGGMHRLVEGGRTVFIDRADPKRLITADANTLGGSSTATETSVRINGSEGEPLATVVELTSGLVRAETAPVSNSGSPAVVGAVIATVAASDDSGSLIQSDSGAIVDAPADAVAPIVEPIIDTPVVDVIAEPIAPVVAPVVDAVVAPIVAPLAPIVDAVVAPIVAPLAPVVAPIVAPLAPIVAPIVAPLAPVVAPIVAPLAPVVAPIVAPLAPVVAPIVAPLAPVVAPIVAPLAPVVAPIVAPLAPVVAPIVAPLAPVVAPILGPLFGGR